MDPGFKTKKWRRVFLPILSHQSGQIEPLFRFSNEPPCLMKLEAGEFGQLDFGDGLPLAPGDEVMD